MDISEAYVIDPSANWLPNSFFLPKPFINNLIEFCNVKNYSKFNMSYILCPIISKSLSLNYTHQRLSINIKSAPQFPSNVWFWIKWIFNIKIGSIFNNFSKLGWNIMKSTRCTPIHQGLSNNIMNVKWGILAWKTLMW
jgi:hypothetical protein